MSRLMTSGHGPLSFLSRHLTSKPVLPGSQITFRRFKTRRDRYGLPMNKVKISQTEVKGRTIGDDIRLNENGQLIKELVAPFNALHLKGPAKYIGGTIMIDLLSGWSPHKIFEEHVREPYIRVEEERTTLIDYMDFERERKWTKAEWKFVRDIDQYCKLCHNLGTSFMSSDSQENKALAIAFWKIACRGNYTASAVALVRLEYQARQAQIRSDAMPNAPEEAWSVVRRAAHHDQWEAAYLFADSLLRDPRSTRNDFLVAIYFARKLAFSDTRPGSASIDGTQRLANNQYSSWKLLTRSLSKIERFESTQEDFDKAVEIGARQYDDPEACFAHAIHLAKVAKDKAHEQNDASRKEWVKFMTKAAMKDWVELMTKAAMANQPKSEHWGRHPRNAAEELGKYYLELHGFYPPKVGRKSLDDIVNPASSMGFDWLNVAIDQYILEPEYVLRPLRHIATVLRENGFVQQSKQALLDTRQQVVEAGKVSKAPPQAYTRAVQRIDDMLKTWDTKPMLAKEVFEPVTKKAG